MVATRATEDNESDEATSNAHLAFPGHSHSYIPSMPSWFSSSTAAHVSFPSAAPRSRKSSQELRGLESTRSSKQQRRFPKASPRGRLQYGPRSTTGPSVGRARWDLLLPLSFQRAAGTAGLQGHGPLGWPWRADGPGWSACLPVGEACKCSMQGIRFLDRGSRVSCSGDGNACCRGKSVTPVIGRDRHEMTVHPSLPRDGSLVTFLIDRQDPSQFWRGWRLATPEQGGLPAPRLFTSRLPAGLRPSDQNRNLPAASRERHAVLHHP